MCRKESALSPKYLAFSEKKKKPVASFFLSQPVLEIMDALKHAVREGFMVVGRRGKLFAVEQRERPKTGAGKKCF